LRIMLEDNDFRNKLTLKLHMFQWCSNGATHLKGITVVHVKKANSMASRRADHGAS